MAKTKLFINGYGRIGRLLHRIVIDQGDKDIEIVGINSRAEPKSHAYLIKYDSVYGVLDHKVDYGDDYISIDGKKIKVFANKDPGQIDFKKEGIDILVECTGKFRDKESCAKQLNAGAKKVLISAPGKGEDISIVMGVNHKNYDSKKHHVISNASCTTNCLAPTIKVLDENFGVDYGQMTTIHSVTRSQSIVDASNSKIRRGRSPLESFIPTSTGASEAIVKIFPKLEGRLNAIAIRVPFTTVSLVDLVVCLKKEVTVEELNKSFLKASKKDLRGILGITNDPVVSVDLKGDSRSAVVDGLSTSMLNGTMAKILVWYDNEWGYTSRLYDLVKMVSRDI